ncbi:MAG TPA: peptidase M64 N-terminal domain-containing protein, partial [Gemmatimonadales bacterium]|nr:peptidase M64 N-terminal domain-containing protein [Gemmatimonadales bacterium]
MRHAPFAAALASALVVTATISSTQAPAFDTYFTDRTMRVDYVHSGGLGQEIVALERVVGDGPWPGSRTRLVDDL